MIAGRPDRVALLATLAVIAGAYAGCLDASFFWDDAVLVLDNPVLARGDIGEILFGQLWSGAAFPSPYHRPAVMLDFLLDQTLFGTNPTGWHAHNLLWHLLAVGLLHRLATGRLGVAAGTVAALLFGLHPIQSEAVVWVAARNDPMAIAGILGALVCLEPTNADDHAHAARPGIARACGAAACALIGALSKETGYLLLLALPAWTLAWDGRLPRARAWLPVLVGLGMAASLRAQVTLQAMTPQALPGDPLREVLGDAFAYTLAWVALPWPLTSATSVWATPGATTLAAAGVALVGVLALGWAGGRRAWLLLALAGALWAPTLSTMLRNGLVGERYLYGSVAFLAVVVAGRLPREVTAWRDRPLVPVALGVWGLASLVALGVRLSQWGSPLALMEAAAREVPDSYVLGRYASEVYRHRDRREALALYHTATETAPLMPLTCTQPVVYLMEDGDAAIAARFVDRAAEASPCGALPNFRVHAILARYAAGRGREAWEGLRGWGPDLPDDLVVLNGAICQDRGDLLCVAQVAGAWSGGVADMLERIALRRAYDAHPTPPG